MPTALRVKGCAQKFSVPFREHIACFDAQLCVTPADCASGEPTSPYGDPEKIAWQHQPCRGGCDTEGAPGNALQSDTCERCNEKCRYAFRPRREEER